MEPGLQSLKEWNVAPPRSVLVVDDESAVCHVMRLALKRAGCGVVTAESPEEALAAIREHTCPVGFIDLNLPGMNGIELCRAIRAEQPGTVTYLLTGYAPEGAAAECRAAGAADLLIKPVDLKVLIALASEALAAEAGGG